SEDDLYNIILEQSGVVVINILTSFTGVRDRMFFFFQAEDGIRDKLVTGVQTCALPILSRATYDPSRQRYGITHVNSVAESNTDIANDTFTNVSAAKALSIATAAAGVLGERPDPLWSRIARGLYIPLAPGGEHHLAFDPAVMVDRSDEDFGGGPITLLFLPSLDLAMGTELRRHDYEYGIRPSSVARVGAASMAIAPRSIAADTIGAAADAVAWFATNFTGGTLKPP